MILLIQVSTVVCLFLVICAWVRGWLIIIYTQPSMTHTHFKTERETVRQERVPKLHSVTWTSCLVRQMYDVFMQFCVLGFYEGKLVARIPESSTLVVKTAMQLFCNLTLSRVLLKGIDGRWRRSTWSLHVHYAAFHILPACSDLIITSLLSHSRSGSVDRLSVWLSDSFNSTNWTLHWDMVRLHPAITMPTWNVP